MCDRTKKFLSNNPDWEPSLKEYTLHHEIYMKFKKKKHLEQSTVIEAGATVLRRDHIMVVRGAHMYGNSLSWES